MQEFDIRKLLRLIKKRAWIIMLITAAITMTSGLISYYILEPEYQTYTTLMIGRPLEYKQEMEYDDVLLNQKLVSTYGEIVKSRIVVKEVLDSLGPGFSYEDLDEKTEVTLVADTEIIKISVRDKDGRMAARIANETANVFMKHVARIMNIENIQVIDIAEIPLKPVKPKPGINMIIAAALGILLSTLSVILYERLDNTVKTQEDIENYFMLPVLGIIPKAV